MIPQESRFSAVLLIQEANHNGARLAKACQTLEISVSTYTAAGCQENHRMEGKVLKNNPHKLSAEEEAEILNICCSREYRDSNPYEIHAFLLDKGIYIASISSFYRVMKKHSLIHHRRNSKSPQRHNTPPERETRQ